MGSYIRVAGDKNLVSLVEAELGPRLLAAYLCDTEADRLIMAGLLDSHYGNSKDRPMLVTSPFLARRHQVSLPALGQRGRCLLDLLQLQGSLEEQAVVYNCLVDQRMVEGVVVCDTQEEASRLCTRPESVPPGMTSCVTRDWYKFFPPSRQASYRSYYINRWRSLYLSPSGGYDRLRDKRQEVQEAAKSRQELVQEVSKVRSRRQKMEQEVILGRKGLEEARSRLLDTNLELRREEQKRDREGDREGRTRMEDQVQEKLVLLEELSTKHRAKREQMRQLEEVMEEEDRRQGEERDRLSLLSEQALPLRSLLEKSHSDLQALTTRRVREEEKQGKARKEEEGVRETLRLLEEELSGFESLAREATGGEDLEVQASYAAIQARINTIMAERLGRGETDYGSQALARYRQLAEEIKVKSKKVSDLQEIHRKLDSQMGSRRELFQSIREKVVNMVERRFALLAGQTLASMHLQLNVDVVKKQLSFTFGPERRSSKVGSLSGGEKSYSQLCLILSLWYFMATPFRCLDEWDVFLDSVNRAQIGAELTKFAAAQEGNYQFIFLSPQGAVEAPSKPGPEFKVFTLGEQAG